MEHLVFLSFCSTSGEPSGPHCHASTRLPRGINKRGHSRWLPWKVPELTVLRPLIREKKGELRLELFGCSVGVASLWDNVGPMAAISSAIGSLFVGPAWAQGVVETSARNIHKPCVVQGFGQCCFSHGSNGESEPIHTYLVG